MAKYGIWAVEFIAFAVLLTLIAQPGAVYAAAPDGAAGAWADTVVSSSQGLTKAGNLVSGARSNPTAALGVAERTDVFPPHDPNTHFSLGFGGQIVLGFDNFICNREGADIEIVETTIETWPDERVDVWVSPDNSVFTLIASAANKDTDVSLPPSILFAKFVKLVDVTNTAGHPDVSDAYDVDGVRAIHSSIGPCDTPPPESGIHIEKFTLVQERSSEICSSKPVTLTMRYTGDGDDATSHSQDSSKVNVDGDPNDTSPVRILVTDKENPSDNRAKVFFDGPVVLGDTFVIDADNAGQNKLGSKTFVFIYRIVGGEILLQSIEFHTSCSQPLFLGNQFGSVQLVGFTDEDGNGV